MPRHRFTPSLDPLEERLALSTLTTPAYREAKAAVRHALADLGRSGNLQRATAAINRAASRIPLARPLLLPVWKAELATVSPAVQGSVIRARRDMYLALDTHLHRGIEAGVITVKGPASRQVSRPAVQALDGYTAFYNQSSITLGLTVTQDGSGRIIFEQQVRSGATLYFEPPVVGEDFPVPPAGFTLTIFAGEGPAPQRINLRDFADKGIVARDGPEPGTIIIQVFEDGF